MRLLIQDLRYAFRMMLKTPALTAVIVLSLAIGIGANTAMFSIMNALFFHPLRYPQPDQLVILWLSSPGEGIAQDWPSPGQFNDIQKQSQAFEELALAIGKNATLTGFKRPERIEAVRSSSALLRLLGAEPLMGRIFLPEEDTPGKPATAVITYGIWRRLFGADPGILQKNVTIDGQSYAVVGVLGPNFSLSHEEMPTNGGLQEAEVFLPLPFTAGLLNDYSQETYNILARLKPGVNLKAAQADIDIIARHIRERDQRDRTFTIRVVPLLDQVVGNVHHTLLMLFGAVAFILLIACANIANLLLARAVGRQKEMGVRTALGARRGRLMRQLLTESILFGLLGGTAGLELAALSLTAVRAFNPGNIPRLDEIGLDHSVMLFTVAISIFTGTIFGLAPALRVLKTDLNSILKAGGRSSHGAGGFDPRRHKVRSSLAVVEIALSLMLLAGAGVLIRSFVRLLQVSPGFDPDHLITMRLSLTDPKYKEDKPTIQFYQALDDSVRNLPGLISVGYVSSLPMAAAGGWGTIDVQGYTPPANEPEIQADQRIASPAYFRTMGIPIKKGRFFTPADILSSQLVVVIDEKMADRFWPKQDPIGKKVRPSSPEIPWSTVVGVVGSVKQYGLDLESRIVVYYPYQQQFAANAYIVARTSKDPASLTEEITQAIRSVDPDVAIYDIDTMGNRLNRSLARQRFSVMMLGAFALVGLILSSIGVYGVLSNLVTEGTHDIGIRMMLGAQQNHILQLVLKHGMGLATIGIVAGLLGALALSHFMQGLLFEVKAVDISTLALVALFLALIALLASYIPARRAMRVDPLATIRNE
ncbi:MAG TPA: ABC transporter permease [Candidatus Angelobacter sp.]|nr:ABC transporter permease [Candidatus Angelobacter sp.]